MRLEVSPDPTVLNRGVNGRFFGLKNFLVSVYRRSDATLVASQTIVTGETATFSLPADTYIVTLLAFLPPTNQIVGGHFYLGVDLSRDTVALIPGVVLSNTPPPVTPTVLDGPPFFIFDQSPDNVTGGAPFAVQATVYDGDGSPANRVFDDVSLSSNGIGFTTNPANRSGDAAGVVRFENLEFPANANGKTVLKISAPGVDAAESNEISVTPAAVVPPQFLTATRVTTAMAGGDPDGGSFMATVGRSTTADGRYMAFTSDATNLVSGDTNGQRDIFIYDRVNGTIERLLALGGAEPNGDSNNPTFSANDRYIVFQSLASNLEAGDTNGVSDIFVYDRTTGTTERVSLGPGNVEGNSDSVVPSISSDGRMVCFASSSTNFGGPGGPPSSLSVYVRDRQSATLEFVSGSNASGGPSFPVISQDGLFVAMATGNSAVVPSDTNGSIDQYVYDRTLAQFQRVLGLGGGEPNNSVVFGILSPDNSTMIVQSSASNLVAGDSNAATDIFRWTRATGQSTRLTVNAQGAEFDGSSLGTSTSDDGRFLVITSSATNAVANDTNGTPDVFIIDLQSGTVRRVVGPGGVESDATNNNQIRISGDGRYIYFLSNSTNLVSGDNNGAFDLFSFKNPFIP